MSSKSGLARMLLLFAALAGASCITLEEAAPPVAMISSMVNKNTAEISQGRDIYVTRCAKCHSVEPVTKYSREKWVQDILPEMAEETNLSVSEAEAVKAYVLAVLASPVINVR